MLINFNFQVYMPKGLKALEHTVIKKLINHKWATFPNNYRNSYNQETIE